MGIIVGISKPVLGSADNPVTDPAADRPNLIVVWWSCNTQPTNYVPATDYWMETP